MAAPSDHSHITDDLSDDEPFSLSSGLRTQKDVKAQSRSPRNWRVPPALLRDPGSPEALEGERLLAEQPRAAGFVPWGAHPDGPVLGGEPPGMAAGPLRPPHPPHPPATVHGS